MKHVIVAITAVVVLSAPFIVFAGLVPCGLDRNDPTTSWNDTLPCNFCDIFVLLHNIFWFITINLAAPLSVLLFMIGAFILMFSGANEGWKTRAKSILRGTLIGVIIVLLSWVIVNTTINVIAGSTTGQPQGFPWPWNAPQCKLAYVP